uniref:Aminopeptidase n=1 Tax=candidate division WOR-3 bacterium TaxID=2052148 RepID=A0A7C4U6A6_UNCW3
MIKKSAEIALKDCLGLKKNESLLVITDTILKDIGKVFFQVGIEIGAEAIYVEILPRLQDGEEPPKSIANALLDVDVAIIPTIKSLSHTKARLEASKKGVRIATLPGITEDILTRTMNVDYYEVKEISEKISIILTRGKNVHVYTDTGTDITFSITGRSAHSDTGILTSPGAFGNLPAGESYIAPIEGTANGIIVIDGSLAGYGLLNRVLKVEVKDGYVESVEGDGSGYLEKIFQRCGKEARNIAEFGIGTNPKAKLTGNILEDEKVMGTVHFAFGNNTTFGGNVYVNSHIDGLVKEPTIEVDDKIIMNKGIFNIE